MQVAIRTWREAEYRAGFETVHFMLYPEIRIFQGLTTLDIVGIYDENSGPVGISRVSVSI